MNLHVVTVTLNPAIDKTIVVDKLEVGGLNRVQSVRTDPGGKGINVAKVLHQFGVDVVAAGIIAGSQGENLLQYLEKQSIRSELLTVSGETRTNLKIVDRTAGVTTELNEYGFEVGLEDLRIFQRRVAKLLENASYLVLSGSLPRQTASTIYYDLAKTAAAMGVKTILDADGEALAEGIKAKPFAIKPNIHELEKLAGHALKNDDEVIAAARRLLVQGVGIVVVSMGAKGAIVIAEEAVYRVAAPVITPQSTVGAGDSMVAVLAYSLLQGYPLEKVAKWITAAGTITASKEGTQVCTLQEVETLAPDIQVQKIC